jgi:hypothetical protein
LNVQEAKENPTELLSQLALDACYPYTATIKNRLRPYICFYDSLQLIESILKPDKGTLGVPELASEGQLYLSKQSEDSLAQAAQLIGDQYC